MKWIKASERLPEMEKVIYLKIDVVKALGNFFEEDGCYKIYVQRNGAHEGYEILYSSPVNGNIEWLDESDTSDLTAAREEGRREGAAQIEALEKRVKELKRERDELKCWLNIQK